jgi:hypothetical protein
MRQLHLQWSSKSERRQNEERCNSQESESTRNKNFRRPSNIVQHADCMLWIQGRNSELYKVPFKPGRPTDSMVNMIP